MKWAACFLWLVTCTLGCAHPIPVWTAKFPERARADTSRDAIGTPSGPQKAEKATEPVPQQSSQSSFTGKAAPLFQHSITQRGRAPLDDKPLVNETGPAARDERPFGIISKWLRAKPASDTHGKSIIDLNNNSATASREVQAAPSNENGAKASSAAEAV